MIKIALTKGRLEDKTVERFAAAGYDVQAVRDKGRKLILPVGEDIQVVLAKAPDVLTYVAVSYTHLDVYKRQPLLLR